MCSSDLAKAIRVQVGPELGVLVITHYQRILSHLEPQYVHIMVDGRVVKSGGDELSRLVEEKGYDWVKKELQ